MLEEKRFMLFSGSDGALNARDAVIHFIEQEIDANLREDEPAFLNYAVAYLRSLIAVLRDLGGVEMISERVIEWERQALRTYDAMGASPEEVSVDRPFLKALFTELRRLSNESGDTV